MKLKLQHKRINKVRTKILFTGDMLCSVLGISVHVFVYV